MNSAALLFSLASCYLSLITFRGSMIDPVGRVLKLGVYSLTHTWFLRWYSISHKLGLWFSWGSHTRESRGEVPPGAFSWSREQLAEQWSCFFGTTPSARIACFPVADTFCTISGHFCCLMGFVCLFVFNVVTHPFNSSQKCRALLGILPQSLKGRIWCKGQADTLIALWLSLFP